MPRTWLANESSDFSELKEISELSNTAWFNSILSSVHPKANIKTKEKAQKVFTRILV
jgi:hypothetical protein